MNTVRLRRQSIAFMAVCAIFWSIAGIFIKLIPWNPLVIAGLRSSIAAVIVGGYMLARRIPFRLNRASLLSGAMLCLTFLSFVSANKLTTSANAIVLQFTAPIFIMLLSSLLYGQRFRLSDYSVVAAVLLGMILCFCDRLSSGSLAGNCIGVLSGFFMGAMFVFTGRADPASRMSGILLGQLFTALAGLPVLLLVPTPASPRAIGFIVILGVVQLGIPYILYGLAVRHCPALVCCLIGALEPLLNPLWVFLFDGELPGRLAAGGGVLVVAAITVWCIRSERSPQ